MRILFTGFDPFGGEKINPAGEAVKMMKNEIQGAEILKLEVPTVFGKAVPSRFMRKIICRLRLSEVSRQ